MAGIMKRRQGGSGDTASGANWMDTYGDMVTLLLTFFVLLFSFSIIDLQKLKQFASSYSKTAVVAIPAQYEPFDMVDVMQMPVGPFLPSSMAIDEGATPVVVDDAFIELVKHVSEFIEDNEIEAEVIASYAQYTVTLRFNESVFFDSGSAVILPEARSTLDAMTAMFEELQPSYKLLRIEGHTDNRPINTYQYPDNWALSQGRSGSVLGYLMNKSDIIDATKITISGYSEYHPVDTNDTAEGRAKNRRVDFVVEGFKD